MGRQGGQSPSYRHAAWLIRNSTVCEQMAALFLASNAAISQKATTIKCHKHLLIR